MSGATAVDALADTEIPPVDAALSPPRSASAAAEAVGVKPGKPGKLSVTEAVEQWIETTAAIEVLSELREKAKETLIEHGKSTGVRAFLGRIAMVATGGSLVFDQAQAQKDLEAAGLAIPKKRTKLGWTLKLLK